MKNRNHIIRLAILFAIGFILIFLTYQTKYRENISLWLFSLLTGIYWIWTIAKDNKEFSNKSNLKRNMSLFIGMFFLFDILVIRFRITDSRNYSTLIEIYSFQDEIDIYIDLKKDYSYVFQKYHTFGSDYEYGSYKLKGDTILFDNKIQRYAPKRMVLEPRNKDFEEYISPNDTVIKYYAFPIDEDGVKYTYNYSLYTIIEDNR